MRGWKFLGVKMILAVTLSAVSTVSMVQAQDSKSKGDESGSSNWFTDFFNPKPPPKKKPTAKNLETAKKSEPAAKPNKEQDEESMMLKREQAAYLRRLAVCDRLREVAVTNNDFALSQKADQLEAQATAVYNQHIAHLKASDAVYEPDQPSPDGASDQDPRRSAATSSKSHPSTTTAERPQAREERP